ESVASAEGVEVGMMREVTKSTAERHCRRPAGYNDNAASDIKTLAARKACGGPYWRPNRLTFCAAVADRCSFPWRLPPPCRWIHRAWGADEWSCRYRRRLRPSRWQAPLLR